MKTSTRQARRAAAAALAVPILFLCAPFLFTAPCLHGVDFEHGYRDMMVLARQEFGLRGELPRWNPYQYAGTPYLGNFQANLHYPPNALFLFLPPEEAYEILVLLHLLLAAGGMYRLTRAFRLKRSACVIAGLAYALSFSVVGRVFAGHLPYLATQCQAPLLLFLLFRTLDRPSLPRSLGLGAVCACILTAGNPQFIYQLALVSAAAVAWRLAALRRQSKPWLRPAAHVAGAVLWSVGAAAIHLWPAFEVAAWASRGPGRSYYGDHAMPPWHALRPGELLSLFAPHFPSSSALQHRLQAGFWHEKSLYVGALPLLAAALAGLQRGRKGLVIFFSVAAAVAVLDAMALDLPVHDLLSRLPGYAAFRVPARSTWIAALCLSVLAAAGWSAAMDRPWSERRRRLAFAAAGLAGAAAAGILMGLTRAAPECIGFAAAVALSLACLRVAPSRPWAGPVAVGFVAINLVALGLSRLERVERESYGAPPWYRDHLGPGRSRHRLLDLTTASWRSVDHEIRLLRGNGYPLLKATLDFYGPAWKDPQDVAESLPRGTRVADAERLRSLNVRWIVSREPLEGLPWTERARERGLILYEDPHPAPYARLRGRPEPPDWRRVDSDTLELATTSDAPAGTLEISEGWMPGWKAWSEAGRLPVRSEHGLLRVDVPAGQRRILLRYEPESWRRGRFVSWIFWLLPAIVLGGSRIARRAVQSAPGPIR